jgi:hypothetical protein
MLRTIPYLLNENTKHTALQLPLYYKEILRRVGANNLSRGILTILYNYEEQILQEMRDMGIKCDDLKNTPDFEQTLLPDKRRTERKIRKKRNEM